MCHKQIILAFLSGFAISLVYYLIKNRKEGLLYLKMYDKQDFLLNRKNEGWTDDGPSVAIRTNTN